MSSSLPLLARFLSVFPTGDSPLTVLSLSPPSSSLSPSFTCRISFLFSQFLRRSLFCLPTPTFPPLPLTSAGHSLLSTGIRSPFVILPILLEEHRVPPLSVRAVHIKSPFFFQKDLCPFFPFLPARPVLYRYIKIFPQPSSLAYPISRRPFIDFPYALN